MYIKNCRNSSEIKQYSPFANCSKLENKSFEIGNFSYTNRYAQATDRYGHKYDGCDFY